MVDATLRRGRRAIHRGRAPIVGDMVHTRTITAVGVSLGYRWAFELRPGGTGGTRLVVRGRSSAPAGLAGRIGRLAELLLLESGYFVMERRMLRGIRRRAARR